MMHAAGGLDADRKKALAGPVVELGLVAVGRQVMPRNPGTDLVVNEQRHVPVIAIERDECWPTPGRGLGVEARLVCRGSIEQTVIVPQNVTGIRKPDCGKTGIVGITIRGGPMHYQAFALRFGVHALDRPEVAGIARTKSVSCKRDRVLRLEDGGEKWIRE
jgi:hypothetical protein